MQLTPSFVALAAASAAVAANASPVSQLHKRAGAPFTFDGRTFQDKGLVGFARIPTDALDSFGETIGGVGSAIALEYFRPSATGGTFSILLQPDRGHNSGGAETSDYRARNHRYLGTLSAQNGTNENISLRYVNSQLYRAGPDYALNFTTGLDPNGTRQSNPRAPNLPIALPNNHISFDTEGLAISSNGLQLFVSDEYQPGIYIIDRTTGVLLNTIVPPPAILPYDATGKLNFTSLSNPTTGRAPNQGFEGLTLDRNTNTLWALLQSATIQDSNKGSKSTNRYTRLLGYDVSNIFNARLIKEHVVPLPQSKSGNTRASSEVHIVDDTTFLVLARDGNGFGNEDAGVSYKHADLISTKNATNIANTPFDQVNLPVSPAGRINNTIVPATYQSFIDLASSAELAKFGLNNGASGVFDRNLLSGKLESLAIASAGDEQNKDDVYLFVVSDNDFITLNGKQAAQDSTGKYVVGSYNDTYALQKGSQDTQFFIYRATIPGYSQAGSAN
ncbi:Phytase-like domain [Ceraceosorus bombacis]|uniref:Phytase-like domain n=1 Tax=Ceraceosorus bombacis TaxID=401625 RepID=A0A0P1BQQ0_9BASI|nr:Phytase-like domain [Ceraceosorus bombacis]